MSYDISSDKDTSEILSLAREAAKAAGGALVRGREEARGTTATKRAQRVILLARWARGRRI